ncbi:hypothetical protein H8B06_19015 [Sphingobacterium sp. DN00404]|uniref:Tetratricopeptide repeat protein n=2 Tax=Sphingobacterium micropteri TaxID=2763501 RepID=A0ABR7YUB8_9SPHI|nr:hypothetical protein [Sphingobacterium micropteri]
MNYMNKFLILTFTCLLYIACSSVQDCKEGINLLPMYGKLTKCAAQIKSDNDFFASVDSKFSDRKTAAVSYIDMAWEYFYKNDLESSMKRFNQAWLLDSTNADVYWGFGNLLGRQNELEESIYFFEKSLKINPFNPRVYESQATSYGQLFSMDQDLNTLNKAIESLRKANTLDKDNPRILAQLTAAYSYFYQKDSANKYLNLTDKIDPQAVHPQVRELLEQKNKR